ncbi:MAG: gas vesicle protein GvpG [Acidobacteria bacterium]|nr:gas vesicle protein GvpG [Acidobacteriota bacterium]
MFLIDDILLTPFRSILWIFNEISNAATQELGDEAAATTAQLSELYMQLETGAITEEEFAAQEEKLLGQLDQLERRKPVDSGVRRHEHS